jgi:hypothetical protein
MRTLIVAGAIVCVMVASALATCGTRGGPGFRDPNGHCVGWSQLGRVCGSPPTQRCAAELKDDGADDAANLEVKAMQANKGRKKIQPQLNSQTTNDE